MMISSLAKVKSQTAADALIPAAQSDDQETRSLAYSALVGLSKVPCNKSFDQEQMNRAKGDGVSGMADPFLPLVL
jgi:hypothetical protein